MAGKSVQLDFTELGQSVGAIDSPAARSRQPTGLTTQHNEIVCKIRFGSIDVVGTSERLAGQDRVRERQVEAWPDLVAAALA